MAMVELHRTQILQAAGRANGILGTVMLESPRRKAVRRFALLHLRNTRIRCYL